jgi:hypothetical protein
MTFTGYYVSSNEVANFVGAIYDNVNAKYTLMGFDISEPVFDMQIQFADETIQGFAGNLDTSSKTFHIAKSCALNLASLRVLVVATGGVVTMAGGNVNYRLGDLSVSKGEVVRLAIEYALKNYENRYSEYLYKLTSGAIGVDRTDSMRSQYCYVNYSQW